MDNGNSSSDSESEEQQQFEEDVDILDDEYDRLLEEYYSTLNVS